MIIPTFKINLGGLNLSTIAQPLAGIDNPVNVIHVLNQPVINPKIKKPNIMVAIIATIPAVVEQDTPTPVAYISPPLAKFKVSKSQTINGGNDSITTPSKKFEPYESLVGISQDRPEIIALVDYSPLFKNGTSTNEFLYHDAQMFLRSLKQTNIKKVIDLTQKSAFVTKTSRDKMKAFSTSLLSLQTMASGLLGVIRNIEKLKNQLDIRDDAQNVNVQDAIQAYIKQYASQRSLSTFVTTSQPTNYDVIDIFSSLGYQGDNVKFLFAPTKVWMQMIYEMKEILKFHSLDFVDITNAHNTADDNATYINKSNITRFALSNSQPQLVRLSSLKDTQLKDLGTAISVITNAFINLYTDIKFNSDDIKLAAILNMVSKEFRYSKGISATTTNNVLSTYYGYQTNETQGNQPLFDSVLGQFGNTITDVSSEKNKSLASIAQQQPTNTSTVLTFESKYIDSDAGTLTPGGSYYVDSVLNTLDGKRYDISKLTDLNKIFSDATNEFSIVTNAMNLLVDDPAPTDVSTLSAAELLNNPKALFEKISSALCDSNGKAKPLVTNDVMASVFSIAADNSYIKSMLFLYFITRISRSYSFNVPFFNTGVDNDNFPVIQQLADNIVDAIIATFDSSHSKQGVDPKSGINAVPIYTIRYTLKYQSSDLLKFVSDLMASVITEFQNNDDAITSNVSRYGGHLDTAIIMSFFDSIVMSIKLFSKQRFLGRDTDTTQEDRLVFFQQTTTSKTTKNTVNNIKTRFIKEISLTQQLIFTTLSTLSNLTHATRNVLNYVESSTATSALTKLSTIISKDLLPFFLSEQQILLFVSNVEDVANKYAEQKNDNIAVIDRSIITPKLRDAVYDFFATSDMMNFKKIITVGIPVGFMSRLKQRIDVRSTLNKSSFNIKQDDIINVCVYKIDVENPTLVFKPVKKLLEMSRFVVQHDASIKQITTPVPGVLSINDVLGVFGTRDLSNGIGDLSEIEYLIARGSDIKAFDDDSYSFLSVEQKQEIYRNHVISAMLEIYTSMMTGLSLNENDFLMVLTKNTVDKNLVKNIIDAQISVIVSRNQLLHQNSNTTTGVLFDSQTSVLNVSSDENIQTTNQDPTTQLTSQDGPISIQSLVSISDLTNTLSSITETQSFTKNMVTPKKFDRVFNVLVDSNEFEIDYDMTVSSPLGKSVFENLLSKGDIVQVQSDTNPRFFLRDRVMEQSNVVFDKYFLTIETFGEQ